MDADRSLDSQMVEVLFRRHYRLDRRRRAHDVQLLSRLPAWAKAELVEHQVPWSTALQLARLAKAPPSDLRWVTRQVVEEQLDAARAALIVERHIETLTKLGLLKP